MLAPGNGFLFNPDYSDVNITMIRKNAVNGARVLQKTCCHLSLKKIISVKVKNYKYNTISF